MQLLILAIAGLAVVYTIALLGLWRYQEHVVFQPPGGIPASPVPAREVRYRASDGVDLFAYVVGVCAPDQSTERGSIGLSCASSTSMCMRSR